MSSLIQLPFFNGPVLQVNGATETLHLLDKGRVPRRIRVDAPKRPGYRHTRGSEQYQRIPERGDGT
jgi:hypothetical protein